MQNNARRGCLGLLCLIVSFSTVVAQVEQDTSRFSITPRIWFGQFDGVEGEGEQIESFVIPLAGATLNFSPRSLPNTNFLLTVLTGEGDGDFNYFGETGGESKAERDDIEFLVRYNFPDRLFSIFYGARYLEFDQTNTIDSSTAFFAPRYEAVTKSELWVAEVGVGGVTDISEDSHHRLFGYVTIGVAFIDFEFSGFEQGDIFGFLMEEEEGSSTEIAYDLNLGYQWNFSPHVSFSARLRGFIITDENDAGQGAFNSIIGPDLALTFRF